MIGTASGLFHLLRRWCILVLAVAIAIMSPAAAQENNTPDFACLIQPKMLLKIGSPVPSLITEVLVDRGTAVRKGDVLARLESSVEEATLALAEARAVNDSAVLSARAKLEFQKRKDERSQQLRKNDNVAISVADEAAASAKVAEGDLREAEVNLQLAQLDMSRSAALLKLRTIRSPIDGVIVERTLGPGEYAFDQSHLLTVAQIDPLVVEVFVPLSQFGKIRLGTPAEIIPEQPVGGRYQATVTVVDKVFDAASATIGVRLELPNPDYILPAGLKCQIRFSDVADGAPTLELGRTQPATLPADAAPSEQVEGHGAPALPSVHRKQSPVAPEKPQAAAPAEPTTSPAVPVVQSVRQGEYGNVHALPPQLDGNAAPDSASAKREQNTVAVEKPQAPAGQAAPAELTAPPANPVVQSEREGGYGEEQAPLPRPKPSIVEVKKGATPAQRALPLAPAATKHP